MSIWDDINQLSKAYSRQETMPFCRLFMALLALVDSAQSKVVTPEDNN
ncbi:MAG: hypothetical protein IKQ25_04025 [Lachnospiraceae bacterium]|nr:hypothetical protein [Lachnospiraceae bacterium]